MEGVLLWAFKAQGEPHAQWVQRDFAEGVGTVGDVKGHRWPARTVPQGRTLATLA